MMDKRKNFIEEVAHYVYNHHVGDMDNITVVFPNRRAGLFFKRYLSALINKPHWAPQVLSIQEFVQSHKACIFPDNIELVSKMFPIYQSLMNTYEEKFEQFYFWGEILLSDFSDVDAYMVDAKKLFTVLKEQKEIDIHFSDFEEEQIILIERFWKSFHSRDSKQKQLFLRNWEILYPLYIKFKANLKSEGMAYQSMYYREVAEELTSGYLNGFERPIIFAGFNALTLSEEKILAHYLSMPQNRVFWDIDDYYISKEYMEAGVFFREYQKHPIFHNSFPKELPAHIDDNKTNVNITACSDSISQVKAVGESIAEMIQKDKDFDINKTAIVLADESLLMPLLNSLPEQIAKINVTMGYPVKHSAFFALVEDALLLQKNKNANKSGYLYFHYKSTLAILNAFRMHIPEAKDIYDSLLRENRIMIAQEVLCTNDKLKTIFSHVESTHFIEYLRKLLFLFAEDSNEMNGAIFVSILKQLNRFEDIISKYFKDLQWDTLQALLLKVLSVIRIPFSGEPLNGLQIMGVLESRNLDFEHIYFISANEDKFPGNPSNNSYIPFNLRKVFRLPGIEQHASIYSYLFYRLFHKAKQIDFYYSTQSSAGKSSEKSRYLLQLLHESSLPITQSVQSSDLDFKIADIISVSKSPAVYELLKSRLLLNGDQAYRLSPTALSSYFSCRLQFYWDYILKVGQLDEIQEGIDGRVFGNIVHDSMELLYTPYLGRIIEKNDFAKIKIEVEKAIQTSFKKNYSMGENEDFEYEGHQIIIAKLAEQLIEKILEVDEKSAPIEIVGLERKDLLLDRVVMVDGKAEKIGLKGTVDRIDAVNNALRVIDYKTGASDVKEMSDFEAFFDRSSKSKFSKAPFQALFYALQVMRSGKIPLSSDMSLQTGIYNLKDLFSDQFDFKLIYDKNKIENVNVILDEFDSYLQKALDEIFDKNVDFDQTENENNCKYCTYKNVCHR